MCRKVLDNSEIADADFLFEL